MTTILIDQVAHAFGKRTVLSSLTTAFPKQRLNAVIGPNGSGKTTLLKILTGIYPRQHGRVTGLAADQDQRTMWIPAHIEMPFAYTVDDVIRMLLQPWLTESGARAMVAAALKAADLTESAGRVFNTMSSGEQHRIALGAAIASGAETLILDEPCANLDIGAAHRFMQKLQAEARHGRTLIISIHDLALAYRHCDHFLLLGEGGAAAAAGSAEVVFASPALKSAFQIEVLFADVGGKRLPVFAPLSE